MLLFVLTLPLICFAAGDVQCPVGFELLGSRCASLCPSGYKANGLLCSLDCNPETDVLCAGKQMTIRRRWGFIKRAVNKVKQTVHRVAAPVVNPVVNTVKSSTGAIVKGTTNWANAVHGWAEYHGQKFVKDVNGFMKPTLSFFEGFVGGANGVLSMFKHLADCASGVVSILANHRWKYYLEYAVRLIRENRPSSAWTRWAAGQINGVGDQIRSKCNNAKNTMKNYFTRVLDAMVVLLKAGEQINQLTGLVGGIFTGRRRLGEGLSGMEGFRSLDDGDFDVAITTADIEHIAEQMIAEHPESDGWTQHRRQEVLEETQSMIRNSLREISEEEDMRRMDWNDLTGVTSFSATAAVGGLTATGEIAMGDNYARNVQYLYGSYCYGRGIEVAGAGVDMGMTFMDKDDVPGDSEVISIGADFPEIEVGCAASIVKIGNRIAGAGFECGGGAGIMPVTLEWVKCKTYQV